MNLQIHYLTFIFKLYIVLVEYNVFFRIKSYNFLMFNIVRINYIIKL